MDFPPTGRSAMLTLANIPTLPTPVLIAGLRELADEMVRRLGRDEAGRLLGISWDEIERLCAEADAIADRQVRR
ncbi:hypothetical protein BST11_26855 [Mycobacterium alsense]|uniref:DUF1127 domain-containing protein n=2 Tax=Mycobacterium alsense TaxID=324058 RepID=A0ABX3R160_9MYCO|nr:hypothetical protein BST11_26855 [Mycobacterium alsense]